MIVCNYIIYIYLYHVSYQNNSIIYYTYHIACCQCNALQFQPIFNALIESLFTTLSSSAEPHQHPLHVLSASTAEPTDTPAACILPTSLPASSANTSKQRQHQLSMHFIRSPTADSILPSILPSFQQQRQHQQAAPTPTQLAHHQIIHCCMYSSIHPPICFLLFRFSARNNQIGEP